MIVASPWCYEDHFIECVRDFIQAVADENYGAALGRLDTRERRWSRAEFVGLLRAHVSGAVTTPYGHRRSAEPTCIAEDGRDVFDVVHRLPVDGRWSDVAVRFRFVQGKGEYFHVLLIGIEPAT